jgi:hypothetical protein
LPKPGSSEWFQRILEEGTAEDLHQLDLANLDLERGWLSRKARHLWSWYQRKEAERLQAGEIINAAHRRILAQAAGSMKGLDFRQAGGTALAACYLHHRCSQDPDWFTGREKGVAQGKAAFIAACPGRV